VGGPIPTTGLTASNQFADGWYAMYAWDTSGATPVRITYTSPFYVANGDDIYAPTSGSSGQSGDVFALLNPMVADAQFTADALANAPAAGGLATGLVVAGSTAHTVRVSGYPAGNRHVGQILRHLPSSEECYIQSQTVAGSVYYFTLGTGQYGVGTGLDRDLPATSRRSGTSWRSSDESRPACPTTRISPRSSAACRGPPWRRPARRRRRST
jgi:hypothetical protein